MASTQDDDMYLFQGDMGQTPGAYTGQTFDTFLDANDVAQNESLAEAGFLNPADASFKREDSNRSRANPALARASTSSASSSTSSESRDFHKRNISTATTASPTAKNEGWNGMSGLSMPANDDYYQDTSMGDDFDADQQMASAFDFDTAASTPSGFDSASINAPKPFVGNHQLRRATQVLAMNNMRGMSPRMTGPPAQFFLGSREASPLNTMLQPSAVPSPWTKPSPSSGLEETFHHMGMNGDSPGNATFSPSMQISYPGNLTYDPESTGTPSSLTKDVSSPPSTTHSYDGQSTLQIQPTSLKSRVETQIPIKMTLYPLPFGVKRMRLPTHTVSKPKFLAKPELDRSPDTLELFVSLVCTSAMQDPAKQKLALARARGEDLSQYTRPSPGSSTSGSSKEDDEKPLNGGEVRICSGCIQRERKRASRKKQKKPEEEEMFQKDEEKRVVVFNTNEVKEWVEVTKDNQLSPDRDSIPPPGTVQVELPMRIACYCRHQNEKIGFQVIFTIKDYRDKVIAQAITNSIMITDDHKTHNAPQQLSTTPLPQMPSASGFPGAGVFSTAGLETSPNEPTKLFKQSFSTPDLTRLPHNFSAAFNGQQPQSSYNMPTTTSGTTSATLTPRNLSRPASPSGPTGPSTKRRKPSGSGKLPSGLMMTRLETVPSYPQTSTMPSTANSSPYTHNMPNFVPASDRPQQAMRPQFFGNSPTMPGGDGTFGSINRSFSLENLPRQAMISAPSSRHPSRPGSPLQSRNSFGTNDPSFPQAVSNQLLNQQTRRSTPVIHKLVPAEGSTSGGTEVTLLGNGFHQGLEVMFGDTEATTTTFWGEKCLNCIAPPAMQAGTVSVMFKHEHPMYSNTQPSPHVRHSVFTYTDDREVEILRLALRTLGRQMGTDDPYLAAQQLLQQGPQTGSTGYAQQDAYGGMSNGHQRQISGLCG